jgi:GNAT superfamily N-acetyltransferase
MTSDLPPIAQHKGVLLTLKPSIMCQGGSIMVHVIEAAEAIEVLVASPDGYVAEITVVPFGLSSDDQWRQVLDDRSIAVPKTYGSMSVRIYKCDGREFAAEAVFAADEAGVQCDNVEVLPSHQRKGIATWMYGIASETFGAPVIPSATRSADSLAFWGGRKMINHREAPASSRFLA